MAKILRESRSSDGLPQATSRAAPEGAQHTIEIGCVVHHTQIDEGISSHHGRLYTQPFGSSGNRPSHFDCGAHDFAQSMNRK